MFRCIYKFIIYESIIYISRRHAARYSSDIFMTEYRERVPKSALSPLLNVERQIRSFKTALNSWVYAANKTSFSKTGNFLYAEEVARENAMMWIKTIMGWKISKASPYETITKYIDELDKMLIIDKKSFKLKEDGSNLTIIYKPSGRCIYQDSCEWLASELALDIEVPCPRAIVFAVAIEIGCGTKYKAEIVEKEIGKICTMRFTPA